MRDKADLLQGSLDLLILEVLVFGPLHGWGVSAGRQPFAEEHESWHLFSGAVEQILQAW